MSTLLYLLMAKLAAACFFMATSQQRLAPLPPRQKQIVRSCGAVLLVAAVAVAKHALGFWAGTFAVLAALMLGCVALPFLSAFRGSPGERHVG